MFKIESLMIEQIKQLQICEKLMDTTSEAFMTIELKTQY
jgi:hypothetical protein